MYRSPVRIAVWPFARIAYLCLDKREFLPFIITVSIVPLYLSKKCEGNVEKFWFDIRLNVFFSNQSSTFRIYIIAATS